MARRNVAMSDFRTLPRHLSRLGPGKRVVAFDVFDTLLRRRVEPESIKDLVARRLAERLAERGLPVDWRLVRHKRRLLEIELGRQKEARGDDHEFRLRELMPVWVAECCQGAADVALVEELVAHELDLERIAAWPTPRIAETLAGLVRAGRRLIFITDSYLDLDDIWSLLRHHGLAEHFAAGYCSSTLLRTKRTGRLFEEVLKAEGLSRAELLFVGDNPYSDVESPRRLGIDVLQIRDADEVKRRTRLQIRGELSGKNRFWIGGLAREIIESEPCHLRASDSPEYDLGVLLAPAFIAFTRHVIDEARRLKLQRLFFLSREGVTFMRMYRRIIRAAGLTDELPPARYLAVSRHATFLPALAGLDLAELHRLLRQYGGQSLNRLLHNLSLPPEEFQPLAARCGLADFEAPIDDPSTHRPLQAFLADAEVQRRFLAHRDEARAAFESYLQAKGFFETPAVGLVDIGWKGSIQDNVIRAIRHRPDCPRLHGLYFGLVHVAEDDVPGSYKSGYMADTRRGDLLEETIFKNGSVFEMFASAGHGGIVGYRSLPRNPSHVKPVIKTEDVERRNFRQYAAAVFQGIEDYFRDYLAVAPLLPGTPDDWKPHFLDQLRRYILYPTAAEARSFLRYSHVESFGVFHVTTYEFKGRWRDILFGGGPFGLPKRLVQALEREFWPEGYLRRLRVPLANFVYDLLETRYACRTLRD